MYYTECDSPVGRLRLAGDGHALTLLDLPSGRSMRQPDPAWQRDATYRVTVNSYLAAGGDRFHVFLDGTERSGGPLDDDGWAPQVLAGVQKTSSHLALADIRESIEELRHYRRKLFGLGT